MSRKRDILPILSKKKATLLIESYVDQMDSKYDISGPKSSVFRKVPCSEATEITGGSISKQLESNVARYCRPINLFNVNSLICERSFSFVHMIHILTFLDFVWIFMFIHFFIHFPLFAIYYHVSYLVSRSTWYTQAITDQRIHVKKVNRPTVSSYVRLQLFRNGSSVSEITNACERSVLQPSQRYFPMAYIHWWKVKNLRGVGSDFRVDRKSRNLWFEQYTA
jgi:hypothetical protein